MSGGLLQRWGLGAVLRWDANDAVRGMTRTQRQAWAVRQAFEGISESGSKIAGGLTRIGLALAPLGLGFGIFAAQGSRLASDLEAQTLTMRVLLGDAAKAEDLISRIRANAAATPFAEGDLIEGSKRLLRLTGSNVDANMELLGLMETMTALNPTKNVLDSVEALLDATSGGGFERLKEFGISFRAEDFAASGRPGGEAWADAVIAAIQQRMDEATRGEDLVGALSRTFTGRKSTLFDAVRNLMREAGMVINREVGPMLEPMTQGVQDLSTDVRAAFELLADRLADVLDNQVQPLIDRMGAWWEGLGADGRAQILAFVGGVGALAVALGGLSTVGLPLFLALVGALSVLTGGLGVLVSLGNLVMTAGGGAAALEALAAAGGGLLAGAAPVLAWAAVIAATIAGVIAVGWQLRDTLSQVFGVLAEEFSFAFGETMPGALDELMAAGRDLWQTFSDLLQLLFGSPQHLRFWHTVGQVIGTVVALLVSWITHAVTALVRLVTFVVDLMRPVLVAVREFTFGLIDLFTGVEGGFTRMLHGLIGLFAAAVGNIANLILGAVETLLGLIASVVEAIPGAESVFGRDFARQGLGVDKITALRDSISDQVVKTTLGVQGAASDREAAKAEATGQAVGESAQISLPDLWVSTTVEADGDVLAKSTGKAAVRASERGIGPALPDRQRGQVLRHGGTVTALRPTEVLP